MTDMEHAIEKAARVVDGILGADPQISREMRGDEPDRIARALAEAGLLSADPDLAATLVWLYGREPGRDGAHGIGLRTIRPTGGYVEMDGYEMRAETAVDLARALLAAAKAATSD